jgi:hypothetical protein
LKEKILGKVWQIKENALPRSGAKMGLLKILFGFMPPGGGWHHHTATTQKVALG